MRLIVFFTLLIAVTGFASADEHELLNQEERQWLESLERPLIVGTEAFYHPYTFVDDQGNLSGVSGDYMRLLAQRLGFEYEVRVYDTFAEMLNAAESREIDIIPLVFAAPERKSYLNFTQPAYETHDHIFTRKETEGTLQLADLSNFRVGTVKGYGRERELGDVQPEIEFVAVATEIDGLRDLSLGRLDAFISEIGTSSYYIQQEAITNLRVAGEVGDATPQTIASRNDWPLLNSILGKGLASITEDERADIQRRWIQVGGIDPQELERLWKQVATAVGLVAMLLLAILTWTFSLKRQVAKNVLQLEQEHSERVALEADKLRLAMAVEQSAEFVMVINDSANIEYANRSFIEACGMTNPVGSPVNSLIDDSSENTLTSALEDMNRSETWQGLIKLRQNEGDPLKVLMTISPIRNDMSQIDGYVLTGRDVTRQEQLESRLRRGEKLSALGTLAAGIAHDFNNLLMPITGYSELIRKEQLPQLQSYLDGIEEASDRARDLIRRIMMFGQEGSGEMVPIDLKAEIEDAISFLRSLLPKSIKLTYKLKECEAILGDRTQIQQILLNLCSNASDAMARDGGELAILLDQRKILKGDVSGAGPGEFAVITVRDTGVGMGDETKARIFDPYFSDKQQASGTGLGLSIVHGIVELHRGVIRVYSAPGKGATFRIFLPIASAEVSERESSPAVEVPRGSGATILLVDDDELVLNTVSSMLKGLGYQVSAWSDPHEALVRLRADPGAFDAVLTDFTMPGMTGVQVASKVKEIRKDMPVSIMTGDASALDSSSALCISKPMQMRELADHMVELLNYGKPVDIATDVNTATETEA